MEVLGEMLRAPNVPQGHRKRKANHKTRFPFTYLDRFMLALLARRFPGFSRFQRSHRTSTETTESNTYVKNTTSVFSVILKRFLREDLLLPDLAWNGKRASACTEKLNMNGRRVA